MHEMALTESIVEMIEEEMPQAGLSRGATGAPRDRRPEPCRAEAIRFCFEAVAHGTVVEGAKLDIVAMPGEGWCFDCEKQTPLAERFGACARLRRTSRAGDERRRHAGEGNGGRLMCSVCGCGTDERRKAGEAAHAHAHGHHRPSRPCASIMITAMITAMITTMIMVMTITHDHDHDRA